LANGTVVTLAYVPANQVSFKLSLVANYADNTNETIFEKSTLPGLAVVNNPVTFGGRIVKQMIAYGLAAVAVSSSLPSSADADFKLNFTAICPESAQLLWRAMEVHAPLVNNGSLAVAVMPPLPVPASVVFPSGFSGLNHTQRHVQWNLIANVQITAPGYAPLSLAGYQSAAAALDWQGNFVSGCTNCATGGGGGTSTSTMGGVTITPSGSSNKASLDVPCPGCTYTPPIPPTEPGVGNPTPPPTETIVNVESSLSGIEVTGVTGQFGSGTVVTPTSGILTTTTTVTVRDKNTGKTISVKTTTSKVGVTDSGVVHSTLNARSIYGNSLAWLSMPFQPQYIEITIGTDAWLINGNVFIPIAVGLVALYLLMRKEV
jgi:hypothetical protein